MCGIVGYVGVQDCTKVLLDGLEKLEYRGYDSAGIAVFQQDILKVVKAKGRLSDLEDKLKEVGAPKGHCGIGHTRWATHGEPSDVNSHPHSGGKVCLIHNGIIENYQQLKEKLIAKGYQFESETDSEVLAKLLDSLYDGDPIKALKETILRVKGSYALGIVFRDDPNTLYAVRKESPLIVGLGEGENFIASDVPAIIAYTHDYYLLEEDEIAVLKADSVTVLDMDSTPIEKTRMTANWDVTAAQKGGYPHFMLKEIDEQPSAIQRTVSPRIQDGLPNLEIDTQRLKDAKGIHIVACGSAMHAGMVGRYIIEQVTRVPVEVDIASEFRYRDPILGKNDVVVIISQSGETADTLAALRLAKQNGAYVIAIVNVVGSSIAREADDVIYTWAGPEISVATTKGYTVQVSILYLLAAQLGLCRGILSQADAKNICEKLLQMPAQVQKVIEQRDSCRHMASLYQNAHSLFYLGRGLDYAVALEGSLKLKEISYIHSEAYAAGELKHGTISLIVEDVPIVALCTQAKTMDKMVSNIKEVKARGGKVLAVCRPETKIACDVADHFIMIEDMDDLFMPITTSVITQMFAYYTAVLKGCDVDKPRNLAKSVTVE